MQRLGTCDPRAWSLWRGGKPFVTVLLVVFAGALASFLPLSHSPDGDLGRFVVLGVVGSATTLVCLRMERARKFLEAANVPNLAATWTFAAALTLGHTLASVIVVLIYCLQWFVQRANHRGRQHRYVFSAATVVIGVRCAQLVHDPLLAGTIVLAVNMALVAAALVASGAAARVRRMANLREQAREIATLGLGWVAALLLGWHALSVVALLPVLVVVQYGALTRAVRQPSTIEPESGALTTRAWHALAALRLSQVRQAIVLQVTGTADPTGGWSQFGAGVRASVRPQDLVGRTEDGFCVLIAGPGGEQLADVLALQMRARLAMMGIDTYVGFAVSPDRGKPVDVQSLAVMANADAIVRAVDISA